MRKVRYVVATSLDGFIAGENGEVDWITIDPEIDFGKLFAEFDTALIGRRSFEFMLDSGNGLLPGLKSYVFSRTLQQSDHPEVTIVASEAESLVTRLREQPGKDIWLFGGGSLFSSLADKGLVDTVEFAIIPVLLGAGVPAAPGLAEKKSLRLTRQKVYGTGIVSLRYAIA